jgi:hypothetical protein
MIPKMIPVAVIAAETNFKRDPDAATMPEAVMTLLIASRKFRTGTAVVERDMTLKMDFKVTGIPTAVIAAIFRT